MNATAIELATDYLGLRIACPLIASASPCTGQPDVLARLEAAGAGAAVLPSLFEEQILRIQGAANGASGRRAAAALSEFPALKQYNSGAHAYLRLVAQAKEAVTIPIIASLNATTPGNWAEHAARIQESGADALELNIYIVPTDASLSGQHIEAQYLDIVCAVRKKIDIPLAVKIGPYVSSLPHFARQLIDAGADGLVLFNRYLEPELNLEAATVEPHLELSRTAELRLPLRWLAILRGQLGDSSLAASSGIHSGHDALRALAAGADVAMVASVLLARGAEYLQTLRTEMVEWLARNEYSSVDQIVGSLSRDRCATPDAFERANYASTLASYMDDGPATS